MEKIARLISVVAIAMALIIAFSGVAAASLLSEYTLEKQTVNRLIGYDRTEIGDQGFDFWKSSSTPKFGSFEGMNAYSKLLATDVQATTTTKVGMTDNPVLNYKIDAEGSNEGSMATGRISAGMSVYVAGGSILSYVERSSASGVWDFSKTIEYVSAIRP